MKKLFVIFFFHVQVELRPYKIYLFVVIVVVVPFYITFIVCSKIYTFVVLY